MKHPFYICPHCGNIIALIRNRGVPIYCCGQQMQELHPGTAEGSGEKHIPVYEIQDQQVSVQVGSTPHPMSQEHYIQWICLETNHGLQYRLLNPGDAPAACFQLCPGEQVADVYAFCNQHDLWKN